ncbi:hypothetical protein BT69DRAFT_1281227 [Atractiella rhizophila]|nr:hypothetical protein BT69DRAFT_1287624 [Atractiella rhizophila]KAH8923666.1 hypothetical protein BT69DRAFT_1281227 [Atractiella rhizophila]
MAQMSPYDRRIEWVKDNKMKLITGIWAASLGGSFFHIYRSPLSFAQKIVQARVYAQVR